MSRVDVVIPCYNYGRFLRDCVQSVLSQAGVDVRVLIVDDCSPDDTPEVGAALVAEDARVEYRRHAVNRGHIATYNEGLIEWAAGDYCVLLSADDLLTPGALARATRLMEREPAVGFTYGRALRAPGPAFAIQPAGDAYVSRVLDGEEFIRQCCEHGTNIVDTPTPVVRTALQQAVGGYRASLPHTGDMEMWLRLAAHAPVGFIDAQQAVYRTHPRQMSVDFAGAGDLRQRAAAFRTVFREHGSRLRDVEGLRALAAERLADECFWAGSKCFDAGNVRPCRRCHCLALALYPPITSTPHWRRFRAKRLLGTGLWARIAPAVRHGRRALQFRVSASQAAAEPAAGA